MRKLELEEVKTIQLKILNATVAFCEENNITYWIDSGTLLGAIRHKGYIPWDDDIDIGMLRPDFERFMAMFNARNTRYRAYCIDNNPDFDYTHGKVLDTATVLFEPDKNGKKLSVNIDIFVYDNARDEKDAEKRYKFRDRCRAFDEIQNLKTEEKQSWKMRAYGVLTKLFPRYFFTKMMSWNAKRYNHIETAYIGNFTAYARILCEKSVFSSFTEAEFEGRKYKIPAGYDRWLRCFYGEYMQLPPEEKRVTHHQYEAYVEEDRDA